MSKRRRVNILTTLLMKTNHDADVDVGGRLCHYCPIAILENTDIIAENRYYNSVHDEAPEALKPY